MVLAYPAHDFQWRATAVNKTNRGFHCIRFYRIVWTHPYVRIRHWNRPHGIRPEKRFGIRLQSNQLFLLAFFFLQQKLQKLLKILNEEIQFIGNMSGFEPALSIKRQSPTKPQPLIRDITLYYSFLLKHPKNHIFICDTPFLYSPKSRLTVPVTRATSTRGATIL